MSYLREHWDGLRSRQRELAWTAIFGLAGVGTLLLAALVLSLWWPSLLDDPASATAGSLIGIVIGIGSGVGGMQIGYRLEDRRERKRRRVTPIKQGTASRLGLTKLPTTYRQRYPLGGISMAEVEENLRHNLPLLVAAGRVDWPKCQPTPRPETMHVAGYEKEAQ